MKMENVNKKSSVVKRRISVLAMILGLVCAFIVPACHKDDENTVVPSNVSSVQSTPNTTNWSSSAVPSPATTAGVGASTTSASTTYSTTSVTSASTYGYGGGQTSSTSGSPVSTGLPANGNTNSSTTSTSNNSTTSRY
jgi:hypothetical protein